MEVVGSDDTRTQLEEHQPVVCGGLHIQLVVDLDQLHVLHQLRVCGKDEAAAVVQEAIQLPRAGDVRHGSIADRVAKVVANCGKNKVFSRVSRHGTERVFAAVGEPLCPQEPLLQLQRFG